MGNFCSIEIYDLSTGIGDNVSSVVNPQCASYMDNNTPLQVYIQYKSYGNYSYADYCSLARGKSYTGVPINQRISNPQLDYSTYYSEYEEYNDDWGTYVGAGEINQTYNNISGQDSALISRVVYPDFYTYTMAPFIYDIGQTGYGLLDFKRTNTGNYPYYNLISSESGWASSNLKTDTTAYNIESGVNRGIVSWAIEVNNDMTISGAYMTTGDSPFLSYITYTGTDIRQSYLRYCIEVGAVECENKEVLDKTICYTGTLTGSRYNSYISGVLAQFQNSVFTDWDSIPQSLNYIDTQTIEQIFGYWSGEIKYYDTFKSGDRLVFDLYPYNYSGIYSGRFYQNPTIPSTGFSLQYPNDFTDIDSLTSGLNNRLSTGISFPVWYNYDCVFGSGNSGVYVTGALLTAQKANNDTISFQSLRNIKSGYNLYFDYVDREKDYNYPNNYTGLKYLLPSTIILEGSYNGNNWFNVDTRTGIDWLKVKPTVITKTGIIGDETGINLELIDADIPEEEINVDLVQSGEFIKLLEFTQSGYTRAGEKCPPANFERTIKVVYPSGFPSGQNPCANIEEEDNNQGDEEPDSSQSDIDPSGKIRPKFNYSFLRTGWNIVNPTTNTITGFPYFDYDYYRVRIGNFNTFNSGYYINTNKFSVKNINLFYGKSGEYYEMNGADQCVIGSNYTVDVQGYVPVTLTGELTVEISGQNKGIKCFNNAPVVSEMEGLSYGDLVKFNNESGRLIVNSGTGYLTDCITGTGCYTTGIVDWFYNPTTKEITFEKDFVACTNSGSGQFSGDYIRLKPAVVNQQLAYGGFFNETFSVSVTTGVQFTGLAIVDILAQNLTGIYNYPITVTGYAESGYYQMTSGISINLNYPIQSDYVAGGATGYINSSAYLNYGNPQTFDSVTINGKTISYSNNTNTYTPPDYYSTSGELINIINSSPEVFLSSASVQNGLIKLDSIVSGNAGNNIILSSIQGNNTGVNPPYFYSSSLTGGQDLYRKITATGTYTGNLNVILYKSGIYSVDNATGIISGPIFTYQGTRDFTGLWNIITGNFYTGYVNFLNEGLSNNYNKYENTIGDSLYAISPRTIDVTVLYTDVLNSNTANNVAKLIISGKNTDYNVVRFLTGSN